MKSTPYEIHITVNIQDSFIGYFCDVCKDNNVKPIILALQTTSNEDIMHDVMTSSVHMGDNVSALLEANRIKNLLEQNKFNVVRVKIETVPWHPAAPSNDGDIMPQDCYFESHVAVHTSDARRKELSIIAEMFDAHMSRNVFKILDEDDFVQMMTIRWYDGLYKDFDVEVDRFIDYLKSKGFELEKKIVEFAVFDSEVSHDAAWIQKSK